MYEKHKRKLKSTRECRKTQKNVENHKRKGKHERILKNTRARCKTQKNVKNIFKNS